MTQLLIQSIEQTTSRAGKPYWKVSTDQGQMSCFESSIAEQIKRMIGQTMDLETATSGAYTNIRGLAKGGDIPAIAYTSQPESIKEVKQPFRPTASNEVTARELVNISVGLATTKEIDLKESAKEVLECYKAFLEELNKNE